jgi:hypothetical protein
VDNRRRGTLDARTGRVKCATAAINLNKEIRHTERRRALEQRLDPSGIIQHAYGALGEHPYASCGISPYWRLGGLDSRCRASERLRDAFSRANGSVFSHAGE